MIGYPPNPSFPRSRESRNAYDMDGSWLQEFLDSGSKPAPYWIRGPERRAGNRKGTSNLNSYGYPAALDYLWIPASQSSRGQALRGNDELRQEDIATGLSTGMTDGEFGQSASSSLNRTRHSAPGQMTRTETPIMANQATPAERTGHLLLWS